LKNSISSKGLHLPIIINQDNVILDGHNRLKICQELGIEPKFEVKEFQDSLQEKEFVIQCTIMYDLLVISIIAKKLSIIIYLGH
jgi:hypothetical protein